MMNPYQFEEDDLKSQNNTQYPQLSTPVNNNNNNTNKFDDFVESLRDLSTSGVEPTTPKDNNSNKDVVTTSSSSSSFSSSSSSSKPDQVVTGSLFSYSNNSSQAPVVNRSLFNHPQFQPQHFTPGPTEPVLTVPLFSLTINQLAAQLNDILLVVTESKNKIVSLEKEIKELKEKQQTQVQPIQSPQPTIIQQQPPQQIQPVLQQQQSPVIQQQQQPQQQFFTTQPPQGQQIYNVPTFGHQPGQPLPYIVPSSGYPQGFNVGKPQMIHIPQQNNVIQQQPQQQPQQQVASQSQQGNFNRDAPPSFPVVQSQIPQPQPFQPKFQLAQGGYIYTQAQSQQPTQPHPQTPTQQPPQQILSQQQQQHTFGVQPQKPMPTTPTVKTTECPMCQKQFPEKEIEGHVQTHFS